MDNTIFNGSRLKAFVRSMDELFGDMNESYIQKFEELLEDTPIEEYLEQEDLSLADTLYLLFINGYIRSPFEREESPQASQG